MIRIGFVVFPHVQQLDLTGPYEVFATLPDIRVELIARNLEPITSVTGLVLAPTETFRTCAALDVLCVPGGVGVNALLEDAETLDFVRRHSINARYVTSVCTGALVLGAAGLLKGRCATTHWSAHDLLTAYGAEPVQERVVRDGNLMTGGGVTAGIDFALTLVAELFGRERAEAVQLQLEYSPAPLFDAGTPASAPASVVAEVRRWAVATRAERELLASRFAARSLDPDAATAALDPRARGSNGGFGSKTTSPGD